MIRNMKLATRFLTLLAFAAAVFTGCRPEERDIDLPSIKVEVRISNSTLKPRKLPSPSTRT